jgi:mono/diheme cytochrome c family protein
MLGMVIMVKRIYVVFSLSIILLAGFGLFFSFASENEMTSVQNMEKGQQVYKKSCMQCHGTDANNGSAPHLVGDTFLKSYHTSDELKQFIKTNMPTNAPGSLTEEDYQAVSQYIWNLNHNVKT